MPESFRPVASILNCPDAGTIWSNSWQTNKDTHEHISTHLTLPDPYPDKYEPPTVTGTSTDERGYPVIHVKAMNYKDAGRPVEGTTYPGDVSRSIVHTGHNKWEIRVEPWNTTTKDE